MDTRLYKITNPKEQTAQISEIAAYLKSGEVVAMPTETVYGLAANTFDVAAVKKIFEAKGRPQDNPLIVHIADISQLYELVSKVPNSALKLAKEFWPGPLTIILPKKSCIPNEVSAGLNTVAVRFPSHPVANAIIKAAGVPLAAPSANISGFPSPTSAEYVCDDMMGRIAAIVDGGDCDFGIESTVISLASNTPVLLRPGAVTAEMLEGVLGKIEINKAVLNPLENGAVAASPGMKYKHYSPKAKIAVVEGNFTQFADYVNSHLSDADYCLCFEGEEKLLTLPSITMGKADDGLSQAKRLFDALRELDKAGAKKVFSRSPSTKGVGLGVCNRLYRAAAFTFLNKQPENGKIIGITGGTGSGKSTFAAFFEKDGAIIIDCDKIAAEVTNEQTVKNALKLAFGDNIFNSDGTLNRKKLSEVAFASQKNTELLNSITHPEIIKICTERAKQAFCAGKTAVIDAPLLFLSGLDKICTHTVRVFAPEDVRIQRIIKRDNITPQLAELRISKQQKEAELAKNSSITVNNYSPFVPESEYIRLKNFLRTKNSI